MVDLEFQNLYTVWGMNVIMIFDYDQDISR